MATHNLIQTVTVGAGGAAAINFTSIPQTYTDLIVYLSGRYDNAVSFNAGALRFNNDSGNNYSYRVLRGNGSAADSFSGTTSYIEFGTNQGSGSTANVFGSNSAYIPNYTGSTFKSVSMNQVAENNAIETRMHFTAGLWSSTSAITLITIFPGGGYNWVQHSSASLYGISKT